MMKKLLAILLVGALLTVGFASCKKKQGNKNTNDPSYEEDDVIVNFARVESVDASGTAQKDEGGQQIYEYFTFESIDDETVEITSYVPQVMGHASGSTSSYIRCFTPHVVVIPEKLNGKTVAKIGKSAFIQRSELTGVVIPDSVTEIADLAFTGCSGLVSLELPAGLTTLGIGAFRDCTALATLTFDPSAPLETVSTEAFKGCTALSSITIPASVKRIGEGAFLNCSVVTSVTIAEGVARIDDQAFQGLTALTSLTLPASLSYIGALNFYGADMTALTVTAPAGCLAATYTAAMLNGNQPVEAMTAE